MSMFFSFIYKQKNKILFAFFVVMLIGIVFSMPRAVHADNITPFLRGLNGGNCPAVNGVSAIPPAIACALGQFNKYALGLALTIPLFITGLAAYIAKTLLGWVLELPNQSGFGFTTNAAVALGWPIVRNLANMLIVIALIGIAMATILRYEPYEAKKLLPKLIVVALLVNFSLVICGILIDASNIVMSYFINFNGQNTLVGGIAPLFNNESLQNAMDIVRSPTALPIVMVATTIGQVFYNIMSAVVLTLYVFLFLFRIMALWILVILSPIAFVCYAIPLATAQKFWTTWWDNFVKWCLIGAASAFFLYIGEQLMMAMTGNIALRELNNTATGIGGVNISVQLSLIFGMLIPGIFLIIGFFTTLQTTAMGASFVTGNARKGFDKLQGYATGAAKWTGKWAADNTGMTRIKNNVQYGLTRVGEGWLFSRGQARADWEARSSATMNDKNRVARANAMTDQEIQRELRNPSSVFSTVNGQQNRAAMLNVMAKRKKLSMLSDTDQMEALRISSKYQNQEDTQNIVAGLSATNKRQIVRGVDTAGLPLRGYQMYEQTVRDAALGSLAEKGQINTMAQADLTPALQRSSANGMDIENVIKALDKTHLEDLLAQGLFDPNTANRLFDEKTRNKVFKTIADKKLMSIMDDQQKLDALLESRTQQYQPKDVLNSMESVDLARIINDDQNLISAGMAPIHDEQTRATASNLLLKRRDLDLIQETHREAAVEEMVRNGTDIEEVERLDHNYAPTNRARTNRLRAANPQRGGETAAAYATRIGNMARNEVLDRDFAKKDSEDLRSLPTNDITTKRIKQLTPEKLEAAYQYASQEVKDHLKSVVQVELNDEAEDIYDRYETALTATPAEPAKAEQLYAAYQKLSKLIAAIYDL